MAQENETMNADAGTNAVESNAVQTAQGCPTWDALGMGGDLPEFFSPGENAKRAGIRVRFLTDKPKKETPSRFNQGAPELWFDIEYQGETFTWTIGQISLLVELKKHEPLGGREFDIRLTPVDDEFRKARPKYRGKDHYVVEPVATPVPGAVQPEISGATSGTVGKAGPDLPAGPAGEEYAADR